MMKLFLVSGETILVFYGPKYSISSCRVSIDDQAIQGPTCIGAHHPVLQINCQDGLDKSSLAASVLIP
jgi:hypothetical protein